MAFVLMTLGKQAQTSEGITFKAEVRKKLSLAPNATSKEAVWSNHIRALNVEQIKAWAAPDGHILWTLANHGWLDFTLNWVATVTRSGVQNFFVATLDDKLSVELKFRGIPCISLNSNLGTEDIEWGSDAFKDRGVEKIKLIITMLEAGLHPMFSDLDVVWLRDPLPFVRLLDKTNMLVSSDSCDVSPDVRLDHCPSIVGNSREVKGSGTFVGKMNVGIHLLRPSALPFVEAWLEEMKASGNMEQLCWNTVFMKSVIMDPSSEADPYCWAMKKKIVAGILPASLFQNGHTYLVQRIDRHLGLQPYAVHASFIAGKYVKMFHFREALHWHVDPLERYSQDIRLLTLNLDLPAEMIRQAGPPAGLEKDLSHANATGHFRLIQHQYLQIKAAAELAKALDRVLVMPQLWCGLENLWGPHTGRMWGGVQYDLPSPCIMSQLFHPGEWMANSTKGGPLPQYMESTYLENERISFRLGDTVDVKSCQKTEGGDKTCCSGSDGACQPKHEALSLEEGISKEAVLKALKGMKDVRILKLSRLHSIWPPSPSTNHTLFDVAFETARRPFCCLAGGEPVQVDIIPLSKTSGSRRVI